MKNGFIKVASATPEVRIAEPKFNADQLIACTLTAAENGAALIVFPELSLSGYTCGNLFRSGLLQKAVLQELNRFAEETQESDILSVVGFPLLRNGSLLNCSAVCQSGKILAVIPKSNLEPRYGTGEGAFFTSAGEIDISGDSDGALPCFGTSILFCHSELPNFRFSVLSGSDLLSGEASAVRAAEAGAAIICNPAAVLETACARQNTRKALEQLSADRSCAVIRSSCGLGETTTDGVYGGHDLIAENGVILAESDADDYGKHIVYTEVDVDLLVSQKSGNSRSAQKNRFHTVFFDSEVQETVLTRTVNPNPFLPADELQAKQTCRTVLNIQVSGFMQRMVKAYAKKAVIGISGGLDSTLALLVAVEACDRLNRPRTDVLAVTMPCFGTTKRTKDNATELCRELGVTFRCVPIGDSVNQHFKDIGHNPSVHDVTYENSQARERTQVLMDIANGCGGLVVGTGDLSELALGWATYNGDHMSMYGVNASVPKTLVRKVVDYYANSKTDNPKVSAILKDILDTPVSPELLPADSSGKIAQKTEDLVGPYELHDFYIYHFLKYGCSPVKLFRLAKQAFGAAYSDTILLKWLETFLRRFFSQQFKRSCLPDGPQVSDVSLSPRGAWCMASDVSSALWMEEIAELKEKLNLL